VTWKKQLADAIPAELASEIETFESQVTLRSKGKIDEKVFAETRLRRGVYGQRYDNGQRHDGTGTRNLDFPTGRETKGPDTIWDAPGMMRIKIPFGGLTPDQMEVLADLAEEYSDEVCHITTRQDVQLHFVHIEDTPNLMRRLAAVGITTREACGNTVRNVTACPLAGVCHDETFDVTPYAKACMEFLIGHPDSQNFGRKFKVAFSGCREHACGLVSMHDLGLIAVTRNVDGIERRGFETYVGGGLGAVPHQAKLFDKFLPEEELMPLAQAISRVFARLGEKKNRARARIKFLVTQLGVDKFKQLVLEERASLQDDPRWTDHLEEAASQSETPLRDPKPLSTNDIEAAGESFREWMQTNVYHQRQTHYTVATVALPLGDLTAQQMRSLAGIARRYVGNTVRTTVEQNIVLRWVSEAELPSLYHDLNAVGLAEPGAGTISDVTACPGTDTCKLGIASSRGLGAELRARLSQENGGLDAAVDRLRIKTSGCFNSCGQHHVADLGLYGVSRNVNGYAVPHFQVVLGGKWIENAGAYGLAIGAVPSKRVPEAITRVTDRFVADRQPDESFQQFIQRFGKRALKDLLADLTTVPSHDENPDFYSDWGDPREFSLSDMGIGECAGEVVSLTEFDLAAAEAQVFEAQLKLEEKHYKQADHFAYQGMLLAAKGLIKTEFIDISDDPDDIIREFRIRFFDTKLFFDKYAGGKFAMYLFRRHEKPEQASTAETSRQLVEEAQLFLEASHSCQTRLATRPALENTAKTSEPSQAN
jgi:sulfite reductase (ferredoxin)